MKAKPQNVDMYISDFPKETQILLEKVRATIQKTAPKAEEVISYSIPAFKYQGRMLAWFAGYKNHIGFYPGASPIVAFKKELSKYKGAKGSVQLPIDKSIPITLISKIVKFKMKEISEKAKK